MLGLEEGLQSNADFFKELLKNGCAMVNDGLRKNSRYGLRNRRRAGCEKIGFAHRESFIHYQMRGPLPMLQTLKITTVLLGFAVALGLFSGCRERIEARPIVSGFDMSGNAKRCEGLDVSETCPEIQEPKDLQKESCKGEGRELVFCKDCSRLCTRPTPPDGAGAAL